MTLAMADMPSSGPAKPGRNDPGGAGPRHGQPTRRTFTDSYKLAIVAEYDSLNVHGARGALLRREGLYQSHLEKWRKARDRGTLTLKKTTPAPNSDTPTKTTAAESTQNRRLEAENKKLTAELEQTRAVLEVLGKTYALLELLSESADRPPKPTN
jgi:transposase